MGQPLCMWMQVKDERSRNAGTMVKQSCGDRAGTGQEIKAEKEKRMQVKNQKAK